MAVGKDGRMLSDKLQDLDVLGTITPAHTAVSVAATTTQLLAANADRRYALFINDSTEDIYVKLGAAAVLHQGVLLKASGGSLELSAKLGNLYLGAINAISTSGSKVVLVTEGE